MREVVVLAGGQPPPHALLARWRDALDGLDATVVAADGGLALAGPLGRRVDLLVGDLDSVAEADVATARREGTRIERHPVDKDATDLELALDAAMAARADRVTVLGGGGGRVDHELSVWLLIAAERYAAAVIRAWSPRGTTDVVRPHHPLILDGATGDVVSLLPMHGAVHAVRTTGLRYPLDGETLDAGTSRGVSNLLDADRATVTVGDGVLLALRPRAGQATPSA